MMANSQEEPIDGDDDNEEERDIEDQNTEGNIEDLQNDEGTPLKDGRTTLHRLMNQAAYEKAIMEGWCEVSKLNAKRLWLKYSMYIEEGFDKEQAMELISQYGTDLS